MEKAEWLKRTCQYNSISIENIIQFGHWFVNNNGDLFVCANEKGDDFQNGAYCIFASDICTNNEGFQQCYDKIVNKLERMQWYQYHYRGFDDAFAVSWYRLKKQLPPKIDIWRIFEQGIVCAVRTFIPQVEKQSIYEEPLILEYLEKTGDFHDNMLRLGIPKDRPSPNAYTIAMTTSHLSHIFSSMMNMRWNNGARYTAQQVVAEWNYFVFVCCSNLHYAHFSSLPEDFSAKERAEIEMAINFYSGDYQYNQNMYISKIGLPSRRDKEQSQKMKNEDVPRKGVPPLQPFVQCLNVDALLQELHERIENASPKDAGMVLRRAIKDKKIASITQELYEAEFGSNAPKWDSIRKYITQTSNPRDFENIVIRTE